MRQPYKRGDRVQWSFRGRPVAGRIQRKLTSRTEIGGQVVAATPDDPRYLLKTESGKLTARRPAALTKIRG